MDKVVNRIADAIEKIFEVKVLKVNVSTVKPKPKRVRYVPGHTKTWKKAIVKLRQRLWLSLDYSDIFTPPSLCPV